MRRRYLPAPTGAFRLAPWLAGMTLAGLTTTIPLAAQTVQRTDLVTSSVSERRAWDVRVDALRRTGALQVLRIREDTLLAGRVHERFTQVHQGVPVHGAQVVRQLDGGQTVSLRGTLYEGITIDATPTLSVSDAIAVIADLTGVTLGPTRAPTLLVLPVENGEYVLVYQAQVATATGITLYFIDAHDGHVVDSYSHLRSVSAVGQATGVHGDNKKISADSLAGTFYAGDDLRPPTIVTYDMQGNLSRTLDFLNGIVSLGLPDVATDSDNVWTDGPNVDAHVYAGWVYDYLYKRFGRQGLDDANIPIRSLVHPVHREDLLTTPAELQGTFFVNAFYAGNGIMVYGEGLPSPYFVTIGGLPVTVTWFSAGLDIVAHELTHGVTAFSSGLIYQNESGALNEAFSDIVSAGVEFFFQPAGGGPLRADYLLGEDVLIPGGGRSMANPVAYGQPDHYSNRYLGTDDNGGVHINSGIANHAFYLAIEGGVHRTSGLAVQGVGSANRAQIERVFYHAFTFGLTPNATFSSARSATIQSARELYGAGSAVEQAITQAWTAVGVN